MASSLTSKKWSRTTRRKCSRCSSGSVKRSAATVTLCSRIHWTPSSRSCSSLTRFLLLIFFIFIFIFHLFLISLILILLIIIPLYSYFFSFIYFYLNCYKLCNSYLSLARKIWNSWKSNQLTLVKTRKSRDIQFDNDYE